MELVTNTALISINGTLVVQLISFLIFLFIINKVMFRPMLSIMGEREDYIDTVNKEIVDADRQLERYHLELSENEKSAIASANHSRNEIVDSGNEKAKEILSASRQEIAALTLKTKSDIDRQIQKARQEIQKESETLAVSIMEKILERRVS